MMTLKEYTDKLDRLTTLMKFRAERNEDYGDLRKKYVDLQYDYMTEILEDYESKVDDDVMLACCEILDYAVKNSQTGNAIYYADSEEFADDVADRAWDDFGEYMLDYPEVYKVEDVIYKGNGSQVWAVDCMFGGYFTPDWDGIEEKIWEDL